MDIYTCARCKGTFWTDEMSSNAGRYTYCKVCFNKIKIEQRERNPEHYRKRQRDWRRDDRSLYPDKYKELDSIKYHNDKELRPEKIVARNKIHELTRTRSKVNIKKPCEVCGTIAEAHHDDYSKPLEVRWLCSVHHKELDYA